MSDREEKAAPLDPPSILMSGLPPEYNLVVKAVVILAVLLIQAPALRNGVSRLFRPPGEGGVEGVLAGELDRLTADEPLEFSKGNYRTGASDGADDDTCR